MLNFASRQHQNFGATLIRLSPEFGEFLQTCLPEFTEMLANLNSSLFP